MFLLLALLLFQATPSGVITGVIRTPAGAPQAGVRVYAIALRNAAEVTTGLTVYEALTQTDAAGQYRLEVSAGRYLIAGGSVEVPIYYPGTADAVAATPVTVAAGAVLDKVDFAGVNPAAVRSGGASLGLVSAFNVVVRNSAAVVSSSATTVSGRVRLQDGSPARGIEVIAVPVPRPGIDISPRNIPKASIVRARADEQGRFHFKILRGDYYVASGTRDAPSFYLGTRVPVTSSSELPDLNVPGVSLSGRVTTAGGVPGLGTRVIVRSSTTRTGPAGLPDFMSDPPIWETIADGVDGTYSVGGLPPGTYVVEVETSIAAPRRGARNVTVGNQAIKGVDISLPTAVVSGKILYDDGSPINDPRLMGDIGFLGANSSTVVQFSGAGTFSTVLEPGEYRVGLPSLPSAQSVSSITAGGWDLQKETLKVTATESVNIEIRLVK